MSIEALTGAVLIFSNESSKPSVHSHFPCYFLGDLRVFLDKQVNIGCPLHLGKFTDFTTMSAEKVGTEFLYACKADFYPFAHDGQ